MSIINSEFHTIVKFIGFAFLFLAQSIHLLFFE